MSPEFQTHILTNEGIEKAKAIAVAFDDLLCQLRAIVLTEGREFSICKTKLEEACFFAKKAMAKNHCQES